MNSLISKLVLIFVIFNLAAFMSIKCDTECVEEQDYSGVTTDCSKFLRCVNGKFVEFECAIGTLFNHVTKSCDFAANAICKV